MRRPSRRRARGHRSCRHIRAGGDGHHGARRLCVGRAQFRGGAPVLETPVGAGTSSVRRTTRRNLGRLAEGIRALGDEASAARRSPASGRDLQGFGSRQACGNCPVWLTRASVRCDPSRDGFIPQQVAKAPPHQSTAVARHLTNIFQPRLVSLPDRTIVRDRPRLGPTWWRRATHKPRRSAHPIGQSRRCEKGRRTAHASDDGESRRAIDREGSTDVGVPDMRGVSADGH
jgi:hypothetical protein